MDELESVGLADKRVETSNYDRYKGRANVTDRIGIISSDLQKSYTHTAKDVKEGRRTIFLCLSTAAKKAVCCEVLGAPIQRFGLILFKYLTDEQGNLADNTKLQGKPLFWAISESRYEELSAIHRSWPLTDTGPDKPQVDLKIRCTDDKWQRMTFTPEPEAHWKKKDGWYKALKEKVSQGQDKLKVIVGRKLTEDEVKDIIGVGQPVSSKPPTQAGEIELGEDVVGDI